MIRRGVLLAALATAPAGLPASLHAQANALTLDEVLDLHRRGVSSRQILRGTQEYCVAFTLTDSVERALVAAGADTTLLAGIRQSCVAPAPPIQLPPGVLVDDNFSAISGLRPFTAVDRLCTAKSNGVGLLMENRRSSSGCAIEYPVELGDVGVRVELTVAGVDGKQGAMAALGFGKGSDSWDQYSFGITNENRFELCLTVRGRCQRLLHEKRAGAAAEGAGPGARLGVEIRGRDVSLYIDGERVGVYAAPQPITGTISLGVGPRSTALFSRMRVERLERLAASQQ